MNKMRKQIAAANWKMNLTMDEAEKLIDEIIAKPHEPGENHQVVFGVPFPYLKIVADKLAGKNNVFLAAQNMSDKDKGAFTGETSAAMLKSVGVQYVIIGHSERREYFQEDDKLLAAKTDAALANNLKPIFCCGEPLNIRESGVEKEYVAEQIEKGLFHLSDGQIQGFVIAYEPIWAIGTGKTATSQQAQEMHEHIRKVIADKYGKATAETVSILYGGSVKGSNAAEIFSQPDVDGGLVGGASLVANEFVQIINSLK